MRWDTSHAVFVSEIDDDHREIFEALAGLQLALGGRGTAAEVGVRTRRLVDRVAEHFAHEERLMRAARYGSLNWHKQQHDGARRCVSEFVGKMQAGDAQAGREMAEYLAVWLDNHTRLADRMLGAFLRNRRRVWKVTFRAGTKAADACGWVDSRGDRFDPEST